MDEQLEGSKVGRRIVLPATFIGGPRDMRKRYMDAMALVQRFGKPDVFLTITCNPGWKKIKDNLEPYEEAQNRPDLLVRVFRAKLEELKVDLIKRKLFGDVVAYVYVVEFQKRGLPHAHFLLIMKLNSKICAPEAFDSIVCAELPNRDKNPHLYKTVVKHMMHGPCGNLNPINVCMKDGHCKYSYPKAFCEETKSGKNSFPVYRRRNDGKVAKVRNHFLTNEWIVPYNPYLVAKFDCHINVEICSTVKSVKYMYKYVYKGHDKIVYNISSNNSNSDIDEIQDFQTARWVSAPEALWRIYRFSLNEMHPSVINLQLHLPREQLVTYRQNDNLENVVRNPMFSKTMLTEFFAMNKRDPCAKELNCLYREFPEHFVWNQKDRVWTRRKQDKVIGRVVAANPVEGERYYLRLLLSHVRRPKSFDDLKIVNHRVVESFRESALLRGLLESDNSLEKCLEEASLYRMPFSLRRLFATILALCAPNNPRKLWEKFESLLSEDFENDPFLPRYRIKNKVLENISDFLESMGRNINDYHLVPYRVGLDRGERIAKEINAEKNIIVLESDLLGVSKLNKDQKYAFDIIMERILSGSSGVFFVDGPGGAGKTFLYRTLLAHVRSRGYIALATATSGVAASVLPGGRTAHSRFKIPINIDDEGVVCRVSKQSSLAKLLVNAKLIVWDEASMAKRQAIESLDKMLRDLNDFDSNFGGKVVVFGGDFRQVLPVVRKGKKQDFVNASFIKSNLWKNIHRITLTENMRAKFDLEFAQYLLRVGNGTEPTNSEGHIKIPSFMAIPYIDEEESLNALVNNIFPDLSIYLTDPYSVMEKAILTPKNNYVHLINNALISRFPGNTREYTSYDKTINANQQMQYEDYLNSLDLPGLPPHKLILKPNCPIILLRNLNPCEGLCNGTRLICQNLEDDVIVAVIATGHYHGKQVFIPRIPLQPSNDENIPVEFKRTQFPIRLCFAMTINKAQGQTLETVGVYLPEPVFSHGQLYVALSRARKASSVKVLIRPPLLGEIPSNYTKNVVYEEVLRLAQERR